MIRTQLRTRLPARGTGTRPSGGCRPRLATAAELPGLHSASLLIARMAFDGKYILMATTDTALGNTRLNMQVNQ